MKTRRPDHQLYVELARILSEFRDVHPDWRGRISGCMDQLDHEVLLESGSRLNRSVRDLEILRQAAPPTSSLH